jgi:hypothetical protein
MANWSLSLQLVDDYGRVTRRTYQMKPILLLADIQVAAQAFVNALEDVTDLGVTRADIVIQDEVTGFDPIEDSNVDVGATFTGYITDKAGKKASLKVPGFKSSLVAGDGTVQITGDTETLAMPCSSATERPSAPGFVASWTSKARSRGRAPAGTRAAQFPPLCGAPHVGEWWTSRVNH